jgi:hypothetical protein
MTRAELHEHFVRRYVATATAQPLRPERLAEIEHALGVHFPAAFREFLTQHGAVRLDPALVRAIAYHVDLWDIRSFLTEMELLDVGRFYANAGMRSSLVGFASDTMGNLFCFERIDLEQPRDDAPVWFFDHEFAEDSKLADGFDAWLGRYVELPAAPKPV